MTRLYCPTCKQFSNGNHIQSPATGTLCCGHCKTALIDWDKIDAFVAKCGGYAVLYYMRKEARRKSNNDENKDCKRIQ